MLSKSFQCCSLSSRQKQQKHPFRK